MKLYIDTSDNRKIVVGLDQDLYETATTDKSQKLLYVINEMLLKKNVSIKEISYIEVNMGPGSFTGLRVGVTVASAIGWVLGVPVNGKDMRKGEIIDITY
ncbi:hypothetical protein IPM62_04940 [Candidatus Woesebacteria bacterium]|nr:MAG: hypothetical protein IPM62_04940 [Candidatus Woesebacteria bacterium]